MSQSGVAVHFAREQVLAMERAAARAWPPQQTVDVDGWLWRSSGGGSRRANSVLPLAFSGTDLAAAIERVETMYRAQRLKSYFQVSSIAAPAGLDTHLERRGYAYEEPVLLLAKMLGRANTDPSTEIEITADPTPAWLRIYTSTVDAVRRATVPATLARVPDKRGFFVFRRAGVPLASALCVVSPDGIAIVECVATEAACRRTGAARQIMSALETWAMQQGASIVALQVVDSNGPARALYETRDYLPAGRYHYRWKNV